MKNFEKYEKEIKEVIGSNGCLETLVSKLANIPFYERDEIANWLYEEYKEPLLTDEEREYLKAVIKPFRVEVSWIENNGYILKIVCGEHASIEIPILYNHLQFERLEGCQQYSLEELGL